MLQPRVTASYVLQNFIVPRDGVIDFTFIDGQVLLHYRDG